jgi:hypothetical protein
LDHQNQGRGIRRLRAHSVRSTSRNCHQTWTFRVVLPRPVAETLVARAIREEKNIGMLVTEILEAAAKKGNG